MCREFEELVRELNDEQWAELVARVEDEHALELAEEQTEREDELFWADLDDLDRD
jgi:hypothetical protein